MSEKYQDITQTSFFADIHEVTYENNLPYRFSYEAQIHTVEDDYDVIKVIKIEKTKDYLNKIGDLEYIEVTLLLGDYLKQIYPERRNLEITVIKTPFKPHKEYDDIFGKKPKVEKTKYKAVLINEANLNLMGKEADRLPTYVLNQNGYISLRFQLMNRRLEALRSLTVSGIYRDEKYEDLLRALIFKRSNETLVDGKPAADGMDIMKPNNENKLKHVIIPEDTLIYDLPEYFQTKGQGIYNSGIGAYFQQYEDKWYWYIYNLYNFKNYEKINRKKIVFLNVPQSKFEGVESTYLVKNDDLIWITCTGDISISDDSDNNNLESGNGFRSVYADSFMNKPVKMTEDGPVAIRKKLNRQIKLNEREDNFSYAPYATGGGIITTNPFDEASKINAKNISIVNLQWDNSDSRIFEPATPCLLRFEQNNKVLELKGIVIASNEITAVVGNNHSSEHYKTVCVVTLFIEKYNERKLSEENQKFD